jgi:hypothetical protein
MASEYHAANAIRQLEPPGFLAMNYGYHTPLSTLIGQVVYGATLGGFLQVERLLWLRVQAGDRAWIYFRPQTAYERLCACCGRTFLAYIRAIADGTEIVAADREGGIPNVAQSGAVNLRPPLRRCLPYFIHARVKTDSQVPQKVWQTRSCTCGGFM